MLCRGSLVEPKEVEVMARECIICDKKTVTGNNVSHSHLKTKRRWLPNLQKVKALINGEVRRVYVCTKCLKAGKIQRAL